MYSRKRPLKSKKDRLEDYGPSIGRLARCLGLKNHRLLQVAGLITAIGVGYDNCFKIVLQSSSNWANLRVP
jgi:hypothetical protein